MRVAVSCSRHVLLCYTKLFSKESNTVENQPEFQVPSHVMTTREDEVTLVQPSVERQGARAVRYGVAVLDDSAMLFRATHVKTDDGTQILDHEPLLAFTATVGHGSVAAGPCEAEEVESLRERLGAGWQPPVETWFADFHAAYDAGMTRGAALPPRFIYEVGHLPNGVIRIQRWAESHDRDYAEHVLAMNAAGEFVTESKVEHGIKGLYDLDTLITGSLSEAVAIAERALSWPTADTSGVSSEDGDDEDFDGNEEEEAVA